MHQRIPKIVKKIKNGKQIISEVKVVMMRKIMLDMGFGFEGIGCLEVTVCQV